MKSCLSDMLNILVLIKENMILTEKAHLIIVNIFERVAHNANPHVDQV